MMIPDNVKLSTVNIALLCIALMLTLLSFVFGVIVIPRDIDSGILYRLFILFNVDLEVNFPTYFSTILLFLIGWHFLQVAYYARILGEPYFFRWLLLGLLFVLMSADEFIQLHEMFNEPIHESLNTGGLLYFGWVLPGTILAIIVAILYIPFLRDLPSGIRRLFILAGVLYLSGVLLLEAIGGLYFQSVGLGEHIDLNYLILTHIEELLEMLGMILFLYVGMYYIRLMLKSMNSKPA